MTANLVQVDYQQLDAIIRRFEQEGQDLRMAQAMVKSGMMDLYGRGWVGQGANQFEREMDGVLLPSMLRTAEALALASETLKAIVQIYQQAEAEAARLFKADGAEFSAKDLPPNVRSLVLQLADLVTTGKPGIDAVMKLKDILAFAVEHRGLTRETAQMIGRILNTLTDSRGNVKLMEGLYHKIFVDLIPHNGPLEKMLTDNLSTLGKGIFIVDALTGTFEDIHKGTYGDNWVKALEVNFTKGGIEMLVEDNEVAAVAILASKVQQVKGMVEIGLARTVTDLFIGDPVMHESIMHNLDIATAARERADLSNLFPRAAEGLVDTFNTSAEGRQQLQISILKGAADVWQHPSFDTLSRAGMDVVWTWGKGNIDTSVTFVKGVFNVGKEAVNIIDGQVDWHLAQSAANNQIGNYVFSRLMPGDASQALLQNARRTALIQNDWYGKIENVVNVN